MKLQISLNGKSRYQTGCSMLKIKRHTSDEKKAEKVTISHFKKEKAELSQLSLLP